MKFSQIPDHENVKRQLRDMVADHRIPHALLLHGPAGIGKFLIARTFSQYLHCQSPLPEGEPCGECPACRQHESFNHVDSLYVFPVVKTDKLKAPVSDDYMTEFKEFVGANPFMDFERWTGYFEKKNAQPVIYVSESEALEQRLSVTTTVSKYKTVIIWLPEKMNEQTANKLLKLIEEPFSDTIFLLVSDNVKAILPTIYSRCRPIEMKRLSDETIASYLTSRLAIDPQDALAMAHIAAGDINSALRAMDATSVSRMFFDYFVRLMRLAYQRDVKALKEWSSDLAALGREQEIKFYDYAQRLIRENFVYNFHVPDLLYLNREEAGFSKNFARFITENNAEKIISEMDRAITDIAGNANGKIVNFDFAIKMIILIKNF
ncbi:DNA polymerase III subunit delta' [uncultured Duncaniella sp.]|uniref:DNA polymerase III subunit n=1 Tax=uncultured Duncaniella sp. TaxID=2768039 RepID=UPI0025DC2065|nr:DNA polymerase III subunit delta' [uncultured Duncaniella sp.]